MNRPKPKLEPVVQLDPHLEDEDEVHVFVKQPTGRSNYSCLTTDKSGLNSAEKPSKKHF